MPVFLLRIIGDTYKLHLQIMTKHTLISDDRLDLSIYDKRKREVTLIAVEKTSQDKLQIVEVRK